MKYLLTILISLFVVPSFASDIPRDLNKRPLTPIEWKAYRAAVGLAMELGNVIRPECVNVHNRSEGSVVYIQWYLNIDNEEPFAPECADLHNSIMVELSEEGEILTLTYVDA